MAYKTVVSLLSMFSLSSFLPEGCNYIVFCSKHAPLRRVHPVSFWLNYFSGNSNIASLKISVFCGTINLNRSEIYVIGIGWKEI